MIAKALNLRLAGVPFRSIADKLGCVTSTAAEWVEDGLSRIVNEPAVNVLKMELARLDAMFAADFPNAIKSGPKHADAVRNCLSIMDRRMRLLGLEQSGARTLNLLATGNHNKIELVFVPGPGEIEDKSDPH